jgi:hypothetical protein
MRQKGLLSLRRCLAPTSLDRSSGKTEAQPMIRTRRSSAARQLTVGADGREKNGQVEDGVDEGRGSI